MELGLGLWLGLGIGLGLGLGLDGVAEARHTVALQEVELERDVLADDVAIVDEEEYLVPQPRAVRRLVRRA